MPETSQTTEEPKEDKAIEASPAPVPQSGAEPSDKQKEPEKEAESQENTTHAEKAGEASTAPLPTAESGTVTATSVTTQVTAVPAETLDTNAPPSSGATAPPSMPSVGLSMASACRAKIQTYDRILTVLDALLGVVCAMLVLWVLKNL